jgi:hypothetical protein
VFLPKIHLIEHVSYGHNSFAREKVWQGQDILASTPDVRNAPTILAKPKDATDAYRVSRKPESVPLGDGAGNVDTRQSIPTCPGANRLLE